MAGPTTRNTKSLALGLAQIRIGSSDTNISTADKALVADDSMGSLAETTLNSNVELWTHESGFPLKQDHSIPIRETASLTASFEEITPFNLALARGLDPTSYSKTNFSGEIGLGNIAAPEYIRMEAIYTYPDLVTEMAIIFPRAQVEPSFELGFQKEDNAAPSVVFNSRIADSNVSGGDATWDNMPLGRIYWPQ